MKAWYHISRHWANPIMEISPMLARIDDDYNEQDKVPFIAVAPSPEQCLIALSSWMDCSPLRLYMTKGIPKAADWVFDYELTQEHRFYEPRTFKFLRETTPTKLIKAGVPNMNICGMTVNSIRQSANLVMAAARTVL